MTDTELRDRLVAFLALPRTLAALCAEFKVTRPTAVLWVGLVAGEPGYGLEVGEAREGARGPRSKTWKIFRVGI